MKEKDSKGRKITLTHSLSNEARIRRNSLCLNRAHQWVPSLSSSPHIPSVKTLRQEISFGGCAINYDCYDILIFRCIDSNSICLSPQKSHVLVLTSQMLTWQTRSFRHQTSYLCDVPWGNHRWVTNGWWGQVLLLKSFSSPKVLCFFLLLHKTFTSLIIIRYYVLCCNRTRTLSSWTAASSTTPRPAVWSSLTSQVDWFSSVSSICVVGSFGVTLSQFQKFAPALSVSHHTYTYTHMRACACMLKF